MKRRIPCAVSSVAVEPELTGTRKWPTMIASRSTSKRAQAVPHPCSDPRLALGGDANDSKFTSCRLLALFPASNESLHMHLVPLGACTAASPSVLVDAIITVQQKTPAINGQALCTFGKSIASSGPNSGTFDNYTVPAMLQTFSRNRC
jgi:hypothetical protein